MGTLHQVCDGLIAEPYLQDSNANQEGSGFYYSQISESLHCQAIHGRY